MLLTVTNPITTKVEPVICMVEVAAFLVVDPPTMLTEETDTATFEAPVVVARSVVKAVDVRVSATPYAEVLLPYTSMDEVRVVDPPVVETVKRRRLSSSLSS